MPHSEASTAPRPRRLASHPGTGVRRPRRVDDDVGVDGRTVAQPAHDTRAGPPSAVDTQAVTAAPAWTVHAWLGEHARHAAPPRTSVRRDARATSSAGREPPGGRGRAQRRRQAVGASAARARRGAAGCRARRGRARPAAAAQPGEEDVAVGGLRRGPADGDVAARRAVAVRGAAVAASRSSDHDLVAGPGEEQRGGRGRRGCRRDDDGPRPAGRRHASTQGPSR